jgi:hypothetical protein
MKTLGFLVDQLSVINLKMWNAQEFLYKIRRMSKDEFKAHYSKEENLDELYEIFKKSCDLNVQRANVTDEIDQYMYDLVKGMQNGDLDKDTLTQKKHKTY